ncbi:MAG: addiction module toxin RelE, partial [Sphingobacteriaceae bacterium]
TLEHNLENLEQKLLLNPKLGDNYGSNIYKIRLGDESKGRGKSGGFRIITYLVYESKNATEILLITIFDKSEETTIKKDDAKNLVALIKRQRNLK